MSSSVMVSMRSSNTEIPRATAEGRPPACPGALLNLSLPPHPRPAALSGRLLTLDEVSVLLKVTCHPKPMHTHRQETGVTRVHPPLPLTPPPAA